MKMNDLSPHQRGVLMTVLGVLVLTPDALLVRLVETDHWTLLFWRSLFAGISLFILNVFLEKSSPNKAISGLFKNGLFSTLMFAGSNICFVISITHTAVANTLVILAATPFIAAILTVCLKQMNLELRTWLTIFSAVLGIVVVFWGRFGDGNTFGDIFALLCAFCMAAALVSVNLNPSINTTAAIGLGSFLTAIFGLCMGADLFITSNRDFIFLVLNGGIIIPIALGLIAYGPKLISAPEVSLIMLLETVLGPFWVWLVLSEKPLQQTFIGGGFVVTAILVNAWLGFRSERSTIIP
jgi:drug/metabolite transporter (DMT)-like permease